METEALLDRMADAYQQAFSRIQIAAEQAAQDAWYALDSYSSDQDEEWEAAFWLIMSAAALAAATLAVTYMQRQFDAEGIPVVLALPSLDWFQDDFNDWKLSPMVAARINRADGLTREEAMTRGAERVSKLSTAAIRQAEQRALADFLADLKFEGEVELTQVPISRRQTRQRADTRVAEVVKFKRVTQQGACGFCEVIADKLYTAPGAAALSPKTLMGAWHNYCRCSWRKVTVREAEEFRPRLSGGEWRERITRRFDAESVQTGE